MRSAIGTTLSFERVFVPLLGKPADHFGEVTIVADTTSWWIAGIRIFEDGFTLALRPGTELFDRIGAAIHRQCGDDIASRLNAFVEERGGYAILFAEAMPADRSRRCANRYPAANDNGIYWIDAA